MKHRLPALLSILCVAALLGSCREDTIISANVTPSVDNIHTFGIGPEFGNDTITLKTTTVYDDSVITSQSITGYPIYHALGWVNEDPYSGNTAGSVYLQVIPPYEGFTLASDPDSGFLVIPYANFMWGDTTTPSTQTFKVYAISDQFSKDSSYIASGSKMVNSEVIGSGSFRIASSPGHLVDSPMVNGVAVAPQLRIELTKSFLHRVAAGLTSDGTNESYLSAFPGFYIVPDSAGVTGKAMPYFRIDASSTDPYSVAAMMLYGRTLSATDTAYTFPFDANYAAHFNRITRSYTQPQGKSLFTASAGGRVMIQNQPGGAIDVVIPNISGLPKNVIINKCQLVITRVSTEADDLFIPPDRIYPQGIDSTGARYAILDRQPVSTADGLTFIDGMPHTTIVGGSTVTQYYINFPRELQAAIVAGRPSIHLHINGTQTFPGAYRLVAAGRDFSDPQYRMALNVVYSKQ